MKQDNLRKIFLAISIVLAVVAVILWAVGAYLIGSLLWIAIPLIAMGICSLLGAGCFFYMFVIEREVKKNYFLYDEALGRNIDIRKMTFEVVNKKMNRYLSAYAPSEGKLWTDRILERSDLGMEASFKPAVAYRLLFGLADRDTDQGWACFEQASAETIEFICTAVEADGELTLAASLRKFKAQQPMNVKAVRDYLVRSKNILRTKLVNYVYSNIDKF